ncbi:class I SAM-dependent methyltransferase [Granulicoccus phenolivorans]|uniref:class I SAM-dependent methyltransferase n=1 Tax=Granulicoccus phenolivorans TaxID=266854 RepID=UPI0004117726|nr:class I SAM-dependent methyltransferase [Granulicoccus phenolivorans]
MTTTELRLDELKTKHRAMWDLGDYPRIADTVIPHMGSDLVAGVRITEGEQVLDVAAGAGNAALPAARRSARVTATDLSDRLLAECDRRARSEGLSVATVPGDAEALPFPDNSFDVITSCVGVMFAPHHQQAAAELVRVGRPGGRIGLASWTPAGFIGQLFAVMKPYAPTPPPGVQPPPLWGSVDHVESLLGDRTVDTKYRTQEVAVDAFTDPVQFRELFKSSYGPTIAVYRNIADDPERTRELDDALDDLTRANWNGGHMRWEYLLFTGTIRG